MLTLGLSLCTLAAGVGCGSVRGERVRASYGSFSDQTVQVHSPRIGGSAIVSDMVTVNPYYTADVISAAAPTMAAPDAITRATEYSETRHEGGLGLTLTTDDWLGSASTNYRLSVEPDYTSHGVSVAVSQELLERSATVAVAGRLGLDEVGRVDAPDFSEPLVTSGADVSWSHVLSPELLAHLVYSLEVREGYQESPYRLVPIYAGAATRPYRVVAESLPERRSRHAWEALGIWSASPDLFLHLAYRFYIDAWGVTSHTGRTELWWSIADDVVRLRPRLRGYSQGGADFYDDHYERESGRFSGDFRLSSMHALTGGLRVDVRLPLESLGTFVIATSWNGTYTIFDEYAPRDNDTAHVIDVAFSLETE